MKKVVLSLIVAGLGISGDCFAGTKKALQNGNLQQNNSLVQVKSVLSKVDVKTKEALKRKDVQVALGATLVLGSGAAAYYFVPSFSNFVNSNAKTVGKAIRSLNSKVFKTIQNSKVGSLLGIKPKPQLGWTKRTANSIASTWNSTPTWGKWTTVGGLGTVAIGCAAWFSGEIGVVAAGCVAVYQKAQPALQKLLPMLFKTATSTASPVV